MAAKLDALDTTTAHAPVTARRLPTQKSTLVARSRANRISHAASHCSKCRGVKRGSEGVLMMRYDG